MRERAFDDDLAIVAVVGHRSNRATHGNVCNIRDLRHWNFPFAGRQLRVAVN
jgi:hypothetical protein